MVGPHPRATHASAIRSTSAPGGTREPTPLTRLPSRPQYDSAPSHDVEFVKNPGRVNDEAQVGSADRGLEGGSGGLPESALRRKRRLIRWMSTQHPHKIIARMGKPIALRAKAHDTGRRREAGPVVRVDVFVGAHKGGGIYAACWCCQANVGLMGRRSEGHAPGETPAGSVEETPARRSDASLEAPPAQ